MTERLTGRRGQRSPSCALVALAFALHFLGMGCEYLDRELHPGRASAREPRCRLDLAARSRGRTPCDASLSRRNCLSALDRSITREECDVREHPGRV